MKRQLFPLTLTTLCLLAGALACGPAPGGDAGIDAGPRPDAGTSDAGVDDAGDDGGPDAGDADGGDADGGAALPYLTELASVDDFAALADAMGWVKYLAPIDGLDRTAPLLEDCYFQDMNVDEYHVMFLQRFEETADITYQEYIDWVLRRPTRRWWGGGVQLVNQPHPGGAGPQTLLFTIYAETMGVSSLTVTDIIEVNDILHGCVTWAPELLAFDASDPEQDALVAQFSAELEAAGVDVW